MFDITPYEQSFLQNFYGVLLYGILAIAGCFMNLNKEGRRRNYRIGTYLFFCGFVLYCLTCAIDTDYYHYWEFVQRLSPAYVTKTGFESFYDWLIISVHKNYFLFRFFVWGSACVLFVLAVKQFKVNVNHALFFIVICNISTFSYARATLGMAVAFYGLALFFHPYRGMMFWRIMGISILLCAPFFHRSIYLLLIVILLAIITPMNKLTTIILLLCFPVITAVVGLFMSKYAFYYIQDEILADRLSSYSEAVKPTSNWKGLIQNVLHYATFYIPLLVSMVALEFKKKKERCPQGIYVLYKIVFFMIIVASSMYFVITTNHIFFYRYLFMTMIPISIVFTYLVDNGIIKWKWYKCVIILGITYNCIGCVYALYKTIELNY